MWLLIYDPNFHATRFLTRPILLSILASEAIRNSWACRCVHSEGWHPAVRYLNAVL
jgi:hypothetical protein